MGYRLRLGLLPQDEKLRFADLSHHQAVEVLGQGEQLHDLKRHHELYVLGSMRGEVETTPFYDFDLTQYEGSEFSILSRDGLIGVIQSIEKELGEHYSAMFESFSKACNADRDEVVLSSRLAGQIASHLMSKKNAWSNEFYSSIQYKTGGDGEMSGSYDLDYAIWNLVHILKTFDFDRNYLILSGW